MEYKMLSSIKSCHDFIEDNMVYWIIGAGKVGSRAVNCLRKKDPDARIILVDSNSDTLHEWKGQVDTVLADGITFLVRHLNKRDDMAVPDWIVPAIPVHIVFEWIRHTLNKRLDILSVPVPEKLDGLLPNPVRGREGELYMSYATFMCPENCPEPPDVCMVTGKPRGTGLYKVLERVTLADYRSVVVRSHQLAPGVGGYQVQALLHARTEVSLSEGRVLISTACSCHGVMHTFRVVKNRGWV
jgi:hypothetical protein